METKYIKEFAKKASNDVLFDAIYYKQFSDEELVIFKNEITVRGLDAQLNEVVKIKELKKNKIKTSINDLSKEDLFNLVVYNSNRFPDEELAFFRNEITLRGLDKEFEDAIEVKKSGDLEFKETVLDGSKDAIDLMEKFNAYTMKTFPLTAERIEARRIEKARTKSLANIIPGVFLLAGGVGLTAVTEGNLIFYTTITVGLLLIGRGVLIR